MKMEIKINKILFDSELLICLISHVFKLFFNSSMAFNDVSVNFFQLLVIYSIGRLCFDFANLIITILKYLI